MIAASGNDRVAVHAIPLTDPKVPSSIPLPKETPDAQGRTSGFAQEMGQYRDTGPENRPAERQGSADKGQAGARGGQEAGKKALTAADLVSQKLGNYLALDAKKHDANKVEQAETLKPVVIKLYEDAHKLSKDLALPSGEFEVSVIAQSSPKFYHNAESAGKKAVWTFQYEDTGLTSIGGTFKITMDRSYADLKGDENKQAKQISDEAVAEVKKLTGSKVVKVVKS